MRRPGGRLAGRVLAARRWYQFASSGYASAFEPAYGAVATEGLRARAVALVRGKEVERSWWSDPIVSISSGAEVGASGKVSVTYDAFGVENGRTALSSFEEAQEVALGAAAAGARVVSAGERDAVRAWVRAAEAALFDPSGRHAAGLVANQSLDFKKQDGVTEIEESLQASVVERRLNDALLADERAGVVRIDRAPAVVCAVQNFSHFLDLSRKVLRNVELGVPALVLSRGSAGQHVFRWVRALCEAVREVEGAPATREAVLDLVHFANCELDVQRRLLREVLDDASPVYATGSRAAAVALKELARRTFASAGGPNTMILAADSALDVGSFAAAARDSAFIENSGQCTALRHVVAPGAQALAPADLERRLLGPAKGGTDEAVSAMASVDALETAQFAALLSEAPELSAGKPASPRFASAADELRAAGYSIVGDAASATSLAARDARDRVAWRVHDLAAPRRDAVFDEHWRRVVLDLTAPKSRAALMDEATIRDLAAWILDAQPISVVVNKASVDDPEALLFARRLWERTAQVVFGVGDVARPALTAQARPQDGEIFGEVPPRARLDAHTAAVVAVPSSTPSYATAYADDYLRSLLASPAPPGPATPVIDACDDDLAKGYCLELLRYLADAAVGPRRAVQGAPRDVLWGLQRPPLGPNGATWLRLSANDAFDDAAPAIVAFLATNAASQLRVSVHPANAAAAARLADALGPAFLQDALATRRTDAQFADDVAAAAPWNVLRAADFRAGAAYGPDARYSLASHFVARLFPIGHVKSTRSDDLAFRHVFEASPKWLRATATYSAA